MEKTMFGRYQDPISVLGFGTGHLPEVELHGKVCPDQDRINEMVSYAYEHGVNYFDSAPLYLNGQCEQALGEAVRPFRREVFLAGKLQGERVKEKRQRQALEQTLKKLGTDYLDYYFFWGINRYFFEEFILRAGVLEDVFHMKEEGMVRRLAFSFHGAPDEIRYIIDRAEEQGFPFDACLVQYNLLDRKNEGMISYAHGKSIGTLAMGPAAGGRLAVPSDLYRRLTGKENPATYDLALRFAMGNPDMDCVLSGMDSLEAVKENIQTAEDMAGGGDSWDSLQDSVDRLQKFGELYCTGCRYCQPCPAGIRIQDIFKCYTYHNVYGLDGYAKGAYLEYLRRGNAYYADCRQCGLCESKCPQGLPVRKELERVDQVLRGLRGDPYQYNEHDHGEYL